MASGLRSELIRKHFTRDVVFITRRNNTEQTMVIKSVWNHPRVTNERDVIKRFQNRTSYLRPLVDEIEQPLEPVTIVLKHLDDDLLNASIKNNLSRREIKYVSRRVLEALRVLHEDGYVHTGNSCTQKKSMRSDIQSSRCQTKQCFRKLQGRRQGS